MQDSTREERIAQMMRQMHCSRTTAERTLDAMTARAPKTADQWAAVLTRKES